MTGTAAATDVAHQQAGSVLHRSELSEQFIAGATVISGSPVISASPFPDATSPAMPNPSPAERVGAFRGVAWSLAFEAGLAALGFALWQVWKLL